MEEATHTEERWAPLELPKLPRCLRGRFEVSNRGQIRSLGHRHAYGCTTVWVPGKILKQRSLQTGIRRCELTANNQKANIFVHEAVAYAFVDNPAKDRFVAFIDGDKSNCSPENLEWVKYGRSQRTKTTPSQSTRCLKKYIMQRPQFLCERLLEKRQCGMHCNECCYQAVISGTKPECKQKFTGKLP